MNINIFSKPSKSHRECQKIKALPSPCWYFIEIYQTRLSRLLKDLCHLFTHYGLLKSTTGYNSLKLNYKLFINSLIQDAIQWVGKGDI